ncbi:MAG: NAD(P)-dependent oxidoreductase [Betaproteobacteria bacterium]|nr:NAD(P)-dependent oxidoreductase [Betaproteobacteria bacterium]MDE2132316.1 NAD(P)-dependent oxidoreductase [Betaproteobacteria bacterium]MDE2212700.1 NAD(P)-dependent oxidoreductase [Betaproteobacteria bacterium]
MHKSALTFLGLGKMGAPMARNLLEGGFPLTVFNRSRPATTGLAEAGATVADAPCEAVVPGGIAITMLSNDAALETVTLGREGFADCLGEGGLHISMSTVSPELSRRLAREHALRGSFFLTAPVFGRPEAAAARKLWICQSGDAEAKARAQPILEALGQGIHDFGEDPGAANVAKLSGNFLILSAIEAMAEALALAEKSGLDRKALAGFLGQTIFSCPIYQNYGPILADRVYEPPGFKLELGMKDVRLVREVAESVTLPMPVADLLHARLLSGLAKGRGQLDWTAIELSTAEEGGLKKAG